MGMLDNAKEIKNVANGLHVVMGEPGCGKTSFVGSYPKPLLYVSLGNDGGYKVLADEKEIMMIEPIKTDKSLFKSGEGKRMYDKLMDLIIEISKAQVDYKTIVIDPLTEVQEDLCNFIKKKKGGKSLNFDEWGQVSQLMEELFKGLEFIATRRYVAVVCHTKTVESEDTMSDNKVTKIIPSFTENTAKRLCKNADMVIWIGVKRIYNKKTDVDSLTRYGIIGANPILPTKIRLPRGFTADNKELLDLTFKGLEELKKTLKTK